MFKLRTVLISCAMVLPLAAHADAPKAHGAIKGHANLIKAEKELINASTAISKSQEANECVFGLEGGHGADAKKEIDAAYQEVYDAAEFVNTHADDCKKVAKPTEKPKKEAAPKAHGALKGHPNLLKAEKSLVASWNAISKSQQANECVFGIEGGHGQKAKEAIEAAFKQVYDAGEYVNTHAKECVKPAAEKPKK
jgi:hypothetical protein